MGSTTKYDSGDMVVNPSTASSIFGTGTYVSDPYGDYYDYGTKYFQIPVAVVATATTLTLNFSLTADDYSYDSLSTHNLLAYGSIYGDFSFQLTAAPTSFRPGDDSDSDDPDISGCDSSARGAVLSLNDCEPTFTAAFVNGGPTDLTYAYPPIAKIKFILASVSSLTGNSTNNGSGTDPDYRINSQSDGFDAPASDHLSVQTADPVNQSGVTVTSLDYGGTAQLTAQAMFPGVSDFYIDRVVQSIGVIDDVNHPENKVPVPGCVSSPEHPVFAQLPRDSDCDGIADGWEDTNSTVSGSHLAADWDAEPGFNSSSPTGDGFAVHDEYRGFHYVQDDGTTVKWAWTDPKVVQDVFFWDSVDGTSCSNAGLSSNCVTTALRAILYLKTNSFAAYRRVTASQANPVSGSSPLGGVHPFSQNTQYSTTAYVLVYEDYSLGANCGATPPIGGDVANSGGFVSNGTPIEFDLTQIGACSTLKSFPVDVHLAQIVAHETGHKFSLSHPLRSGPVTNVSPTPSDVQTLTLIQYSRSDTSNIHFFVRLQRYDYGSGTEVSDFVLSLQNLAGITISSKTTLPPTGVSNCLTLSDCIYDVTTGSAIPSTPNSILVENQLQHIMDWTPRYTLNNIGDWTYASGDSQNIYVKYH